MSRARRTLQLGDLVLKHMVRRVHQATVDRTELLEGEEIRAVLGLLEAERRGQDDRDSARAVVGIEFVAVVQGNRGIALIILVGASFFGRFHRLIKRY